MSKGRYSIDMTTGSLMPKIIKFTIPILLTGLLQIFYNAADIVVVGRFAGSSTYLAAVGATSTLVNLMFNLFFGISVGAGIVVAKYIGAGDGKAIHRSVHTSMLFSLLSGVILGVCSYFLSPFLLTLMKTPDDILPLSAVYLKIFFIGAPATVIYNFGASILRSTGDSKRPLYILALTGIINILLNLLFVIQFKMNVRGVAVATVIAQYISAVIVLFILLNTDGFIRLIPSKLRFYKTELLEILKIGLPAGLQGSLFSFSNTIIQSSVNTLWRGNHCRQHRRHKHRQHHLHQYKRRGADNNHVYFSKPRRKQFKKNKKNIFLLHAARIFVFIGFVHGFLHFPHSASRHIHHRPRGYKNGKYTRWTFCVYLLPEQSH